MEKLEKANYSDLWMAPVLADATAWAELSRSDFVIQIGVRCNVVETAWNDLDLLGKPLVSFHMEELKEEKGYGNLLLYQDRKVSLHLSR